jgi:hypothetical protein
MLNEKLVKRMRNRKMLAVRLVPTIGVPTMIPAVLAERPSLAAASASVWGPSWLWAFSRLVDGACSAA